MESITVKTACQACHCECGVLVTVEDGKVTKIEGDPDHPMNEGMLCAKGLAYTQFLYHPDRLKYPLKRIGERGQGKWKRISWNEALDTIASELKRIKNNYGPEAIAFSFGSGPRGHIAAFAGLLYSIGSPNVSCTDCHYCFSPSIIAETATWGRFITAEVGPDYKNSKCILLWGANTTESHPARAKDIFVGKRSGAKLIVVDPRFTQLASKSDLWLQVRPGTDDALALGMMNVIINEGIYDKEFVEKWCVGFEKLKERVKEYSPERVSEITWIPREKIEKAARMYATIKPAVLHHRVAVEMHLNTTQTCRAIALLIALTGNLDVKGGNLFPLYPKGYVHRYTFCFAKDVRENACEEKRLGANEYPLLSGPESPWGFAYPPAMIKAALTGKPYPLKAWIAPNNLLLGLENSRQVFEALKNLELLVVPEFFMTPTAELADFVLPAAMWLEKDELCESSYNNFIAARQKVIEPLYECMDEMKMAFEIAKRMGLKLYPKFPIENVEDYNDYRLKQVGMTFEELKKKGYIIEPMQYRKYELGLLRADGKAGFNTPSGKVELFSTIFEKYNYDPLPDYKENPESPVSTPELMKEYPFILITGGRHVAYFHSGGRQIPWLRELRPDPLIEIHPETANGLGIEDGDWVWIETPRMKGRIKQRAKLTEGIHPNVVHAEAHWWFPEKPGPDHGCWESNINVIVSSEGPYDPVVGTVPLRGLLCRIYKVQAD